MKPRLHLRTLFCVVAVAPCLWATSVFAQTADALIRARPDFQNQLYLAAPTNAPGTALAQPAAVALFSGSVGDATNVTNPAPNDGLVFLAQAGIGQAFFTPASSNGPPEFVVQPTNTVAAASSNATLSVVIGSTTPLTYQWYRNGVALAGATNATLTLNNAQPANAGNYTVVVSNAFGSVTSQVATLTVETTFARILTENVATNTGQFEGVASGDFDGDGLPDLFVANFSGTNVLYRNLGNGSFSRLTNGVIAGDPVSRQSYAGSWGDYDNDGNLDLIVANNNGQNSLYRNLGGGNFTAITNSAMSSEPGNAGSRTAVWGDYDNDGWLDCFVANGGGTSVNFLYRNNRDGTFTKILAGDPSLNGGGSFGAAWGDYDNDGRLDLFVSNQTGASRNLLYHNEGGGVFTSITAGPGAPSTIDSRGCAWGDYDNDGYLDLIVANKTLAPNLLYHNDGHSGFTLVSSGPIGTDMSHSVGVTWGDYDNDGWLDLFVANEGENNFLYHNNGDGTFTRVTSGALVNDGGLSRSASWTDLNNDGFLDLFVANIGLPAGTNFFYINNGNSNSWLKVNLVGRTSNRSAIGAKVRVQAVIGGVPRWQLREVSGGGYGQNSLAQNFGLGDATNIDLLRIEWPSGVVQTLSNVAPRQFLTIAETAPPVIDLQPTNRTIVAYSNLTLSVQARGSESLSYRWFRNGVLVSVSTNSFFSISNAQPANAGNYTVVVSNAFGSVTSLVATLTVETTFAKVTTGALANAKMYAVAWGDYDNDGWPDLSALMNPQFSGDAVLYHNTNGHFTAVTNSQWAAEGAPDFGITWGDYDNDGLADLFVSSYSGGSGRLYHNNGNGVFTRVPAWGGESDAEYSANCSWVDYDRDGYLDLFVANGFNAISANLLYHNNRNGTFTRILAGAIATDIGNSVCGVWGDYDNDGWPDLFVSNSGGVSFLYHNNGNGAFTRILTGAVASDSGLAAGSSWADYDNDGYLDLFVAVDAGQGSRLYHNNQNGTFSRVTSPVETGGSSVNGAWGDFDNDGNVDLFISNYNGVSPANYFYVNNGVGNFSKATNNVLASEGGYSYGAAWADFNRDGFLDLVVANGWNGNAFVYRNNGSSNSWLSVRCRGTASNRDAVGAKVRVTATINGSSRTQMREIGGLSSFASQNEPAQHFGLGDATNVSLLRIEWPSGKVQQFTNVAPQQFLTIQEQTTFYFAVNGSGSVSYSPVQSNYFIGEPLTLTATPRNTNWTRFLRWSDGNTNAARTYTVGLSNVLTAIFTNTVPLEELVFKEWDKAFGGTARDSCQSAARTTDGGFLLAGESWSTTGSGNKSTPNYGLSDFWVVRLGADGNRLWDQTIGGTSFDGAKVVRETRAGQIIVGGTSTSGNDGNRMVARHHGGRDFWLVWLDAAGNIIRQSGYGGTNDEELLSLEETMDGGLILAGSSSSEPDTSPDLNGNKTSPNRGNWVVRTDANGVKLWDRTVGTNGGLACCIKQTTDGGFIVGGNFWVLRLDANGNTLWERSYGTPVDTFGFLQAIVATGDGGFVLGGFFEGTASGSLVIRIDSSGNELARWTSPFGGFTLASLVEAPDGGLLAGASVNFPSDYAIARLDSGGMEAWESTYGGTAGDSLNTISTTPDGYLLAGESSSGVSGTKTAPFFGGAGDFWAVRITVREAPVGTPAVLVNGLYSTSNSFAIPATNIPVSITLTSTFPGGYIYYSLDGVTPVPGEANTFEYSAPGNPGAPFVVSNSVVVLAVAYSSDATGNVEVDADPVAINIVPLYNLTDTSPGGGSVAMNPPGGVYLSNTVVTLTASPASGWTFLRWEGAVTNTGNPLALTMDGTKTIRAVFGTGLTTTTNVAGASVALWPPTGPYPYGSLVRLVGVPNAGNRFNRWFSNISGPTTSILDFTVLTANTNIPAFFAALSGNNFTLTTLLNGYGTVTRNPAANFYISNTTVLLTAAPDTGYAFTGWSGDLSGTSTQINVTLNTNKTVTANFLPTAPPVITAQPQNLTVNRDSNATFTVTATGVPAPAYQWLHAGTNLPGATGATLNIASAQKADGGGYYVIVTNMFGSTTSAVAVLTVELPYAFVTLAGAAGQPGYLDSTGTLARFNYTTSPAADAGGNVFIADYIGNTIRRIDPNAVVTTLAGLSGNQGGADGTGAAARFYYPWGLAINSAGTLYVGDGYNRAIRQITPGGVVSTLATGFGEPVGVALDTNGIVYVADYSSHVVRKVTPGGMVTTLAGLEGNPGHVDAVGSAARFHGPIGVAVDASGNVFVAELDNNHTIRKITPGGAVSTLAGAPGEAGFIDGAGSSARFNRPSGLAIDLNGNLYVGDMVNRAIRKITPAGVVTTVGGGSGIGSEDGPGSSARFYGDPGLIGVGVDRAGNLLVGDQYNHTVRKGIPDYGQPIIYGQPRSQTNFASSSVALSVATTGRPPLAYQWSFNGTNLAGATSATLNIASFQAGNAGSYFVVVSNGYGSATSSVAVLSLAVGPNQPPLVALTSPGAGATFIAPANVSLSVSASDAEGSVTQVMFFAGATLLGRVTNAASSFTWTNAPLGGPTLKAVATDNGGLSATSAPVSITVNPASHGAAVFAAMDRTTARVGETVTATIQVIDFDGFLDGLTITNLQLQVHHAAPVGDVSSGNLLAASVTLSNYYAAPGNAASLLVRTSSFVVLPADGVYLTADAIVDGRDNHNGIGGSSIADTFRLTFPVEVRVSQSALCVTRGCVNAGDGSGVLAFSGSVSNCGSTLLTNVVVSNLLGGVFTYVAGPISLATNQGLAFAGSYSNVPFGTFVSDTLHAWGTDNGAFTASNSASATCSNVFSGPPRFAWSNAAVNVGERDVTVTLLVTRNFNGLATVNYATGDGSATAVADYDATAGQLQFQNGQFVKPITVTILDDSVVEGNHAFSVTLSQPLTNGVPLPNGLASPAVATVTIVDDDLPMGSSFLTVKPVTPINPNALGSLRVFLTGDTNLGQWRLPWERSWRNSGDTAGGLQPGLYDVEFKLLSGFLPPAPVTVAVNAASTTLSTNGYTFLVSTPAGSLTVFLDPAEVATDGNVGCRGQWSIPGHAFLNSGATVTGLPAGSYTVTFKGLEASCGWSVPLPRDATVRPGLSNSFRASYVTNVAGPAVPAALVFATEIQPYYDNTAQPYTYCGQITTEYGSGSGVVVKERVVLTAAHVVFDDFNLGWAGNARWFFQRHAPEYNPAPQEVRGYYVNSGYAARRQAEGTPGVSTTASFDLDVAALYFYEAAGRGGYGGYLVSESPGIMWMNTNAHPPVTSRALVGYPVEGIAPAGLGKMHRIGPGSLSFDQTTTTGAVWTCTQIRGLPGNSGGPLLMQIGDGRYFPAGIYVGGSDKAIVRAIDSRAVDVINSAELTSNLGTNQTGGGVIRFGVAVPAGTCYEFATVTLEPASALAAGAQWRVHYKATGLSPWTNSSSYHIVLNNKPDFLELAEAEGFLTPDASNLSLGCLATNLSFTYVQLLPRLDALDGRHLILSGVTSRTYRVEYAPHLAPPGAWTPLTNISLPANNSLMVISNALAPVTTNRFFRAVRVP